MRILYTLLWILILPLALIRLFWRGRLEPGYRQHIAERFGIYAAKTRPDRRIIWVHAVSVGETRAAEPLIRQLKQKYPNHRILLSHMTPTGRATGALIFSNKEVLQCYLPYDIPFLIQGLLRHFKPVICILMETEVWPNLIYTCQEQDIPVILVNARLSPKSLRKAEQFHTIIRPVSAALTRVFAQTETDASRMRQLGVLDVTVTGNSKFDVSINPEQIKAGQALRQQLGPRPVLLCASTREGEEELILDAFIQFKKSAHNSPAQSDILLMIVPRHPQRFDQVAQLIKQRGLSMERRTTLKQNKLDANVCVILGDTMGELIAYYVSADVAYIGGSLLPLGGQNLIEACAVEKPVILGPHTFNFETISLDAIEAKCALRVTNADELMAAATQLINDNERRQIMGNSALAFANQHRGSTERTMTLLRDFIR